MNTPDEPRPLISDSEIEKALDGYRLTELRGMRDHLETALREAMPAAAQRLDVICRCVPRHGAAAFTALMASECGADRRRLKMLRLLSGYIHARERKATGNRPPVPAPAAPLDPAQISLPLPALPEPQP